MELENTVYSIDICPKGLFILVGLVSGQILIFHISYMIKCPKRIEPFIVQEKETAGDEIEMSIKRINFCRNSGELYQTHTSFCPALIKVSPIIPANNQIDTKVDKRINKSSISPLAKIKELSPPNRFDFNKFSSEIDNNSSNIYEDKEIPSTITSEEYDSYDTENDLSQFDRRRREREKEKVMNKIKGNTSPRNNSPRSNNSPASNSPRNYNSSGNNSPRNVDMKNVPGISSSPFKRHCTFAVAWLDGRVSLNEILIDTEETDNFTEGEEERDCPIINQIVKIGIKDNTKEISINDINKEENTIISQIKSENTALGTVNIMNKMEKKKIESEHITTQYKWSATHLLQTEENFCNLQFYNFDLNKSSRGIDNDPIYFVALSLSGMCFFLDASDGTITKNNKKNNQSTEITPKTNISYTNSIECLQEFKNIFTYNTKLFFNGSNYSLNDGIDDIEYAKNFICGTYYCTCAGYTLH